MASIDIHHRHKLEPDAARALVDAMAAKLNARHGLCCDWRDGALAFSRPGIEGRIELAPNAIRVVAELGFLFAPMRAVIEREISAELARRLAD